MKIFAAAVVIVNGFVDFLAETGKLGWPSG